MTRPSIPSRYRIKTVCIYKTETRLKLDQTRLNKTKLKENLDRHSARKERAREEDRQASAAVRRIAICRASLSNLRTTSNARRLNAGVSLALAIAIVLASIAKALPR